MAGRKEYPRKIMVMKRRRDWGREAEETEEAAECSYYKTHHDDTYTIKTSASSHTQSEFSPDICAKHRRGT